MALSFFVKESDTIKVEVYVYEKDGNLEATSDVNEVPVSSQDSVKNVSFTFRRPNYRDSQKILGNSTSSVIGGEPQVYPMKFSDIVLNTLLSAWTLTDDAEKPVPKTTKNIDALHPSIARAATSGVLDKISL